MKKIFMLAAVIGMIGLLCAGCGKKKIRSMEAVLDADDPYIYDMTDIDQESLREAWGEPVKVTTYSDIWQTTHNGDTAYVEAQYDENGNVITVGHSYPLYALVADADKRVGVFTKSDYVIDSDELFFIPSEDIFGNTIDIAYGDRLYFLYFGAVLETYPAQIFPPYSALKTGTVSGQDSQKLEEIFEWYQEFCAGGT